MARSYLGRNDGFADGFTSGFGLINDAINDKRKIDAAEEELQYRRGLDTQESDRYRLDREERARQFDATETRLTDSAEADAQYRTDQANRQAEEARLTLAFRTGQEERAAEEKKLTADFRTDQLGLAKQESDAKIAVSEAELGAIQNAEKDKEAQEAIFQIDAMVRRARETGVAPDMEVLLSLIDKTSSGGTYDINTILGEDFKENLATFTSTISEMIQGGNFDPEDPRIIAGFDAIVNARQGRLIGATVDESFTNAPEQYRDGTWEVVSREARDLSIDEGSDEFGPPALEIGSNVLVTIRKKKKSENGQILYANYIAPLTESRDPKSGEQVKIQANEFIDGVAGTSVLTDYFDSSGLNNVFKAAEIERMGGYSEFEKRKQEIVSQLTRERDGGDNYAPDPNSRSLGFAKNNSEVSNQEIERLAESRVLGRGKRQASYRDQANTTLLVTSEAIKTEMGLAKYVVRENGKNKPLKVEDLDDQTLFRIAATLKTRGDRQIVTPETRRILEEFTESRGGKVVGGNKQGIPNPFSALFGTNP